MPEVYLASRSPRRAELLQTLGVDFRIVDVTIDEAVRAGEISADYVLRLAAAKAAAGHAQVPPGGAVLAADTCVVIDNEIIGKPRDRLDAMAILQRLSGQWHEVLTGVALAVATTATVCVTTRVQMRRLTDREIAAYWASGEPADKAGAYGIQGLGGALVERIEGSYSNVVGLPLAETLVLLDGARITHRLS